MKILDITPSKLTGNDLHDYIEEQVWKTQEGKQRILPGKLRATNNQIRTLKDQKSNFIEDESYKSEHLYLTKYNIMQIVTK